MSNTIKNAYKILVIQGPNLNLLGTREASLYGSQTLAQLEADLDILGAQEGAYVTHFNSNSESALIDKIQQSKNQVDFFLINAGAYTHTSIALRDALLAVDIPFFEIHITNIHAREPFRHHSYLADKAIGVICGFGVSGYEYALSAAISYLKYKRL